jgi:hypothetical protein
MYLAPLKVGCVCALLGLATCPALAQEQDEQTEQTEKTFGGYDCAGDCSGHKAGYDSAMGNLTLDEASCGEGSASFAEGCKVFAEDPSRGSDVDDQGNPIEGNPE